MSEVNLESDQARWAQECCKGGDCPVCNGGYEENDEVPDCGVCGVTDHVERNSLHDWYCTECNWCEEDDKDVPKEEVLNG